MQRLIAQRATLRSGVKCRSTGESSSSTPTAVKEDVKISKTISTLDSLLDVKPEPVKPRAAEPSKPAATTANQSGVFSWQTGQASGQPAGVKPAARQPENQSFDKVMGFDGYAPEIINGRAAMLGFLAAITTEFSTGESVYAQLIGGGGSQAAIIIAAVVLASFAPAVRGVPLDEVFNKNTKKGKVKALGPFAPDAELLNGRYAMVALALIVLLEGTSGAAFFL